MSARPAGIACALLLLSATLAADEPGCELPNS